MNKLLVIDTETTGLDPKAGDAICEIACVEVALNAAGAWSIGAMRSSLVNPLRPIPATASAVHHLVDADVAGAPQLPMALWRVMPSGSWPKPTPVGEALSDTGTFPDWPIAYVAHKAAFEDGFLPMLSGAPWIDTHRCALHIFPDAPGHANQVLRYWLDLNPNAPQFQMIGPPHRARHDAVVTALILCKMLGLWKVADLIEMCTKPVLLAVCPFERYKGMSWRDIPLDYLQWCRDKAFLSLDVRHTVRHEIARREAFHRPREGRFI